MQCRTYNKAFAKLTTTVKSAQSIVQC